MSDMAHGWPNVWLLILLMILKHIWHMVKTLK
jgi:hypothetical protein